MRARLTGVLAAGVAALLVAGCGGGGGEPAAKSSATPSRAAATKPPIPLPSSVPTVGSITDPAANAVWLLRSTGTEDASSYDAPAQVSFIDGDVAVYAAQDTVTGVSTKDGKPLWESPVDMHGDVLTAVAPSPTTKHSWTFAFNNTHYSEDYQDTGDHVVTIDTRTGKVLADEAVDGFGDIERMVMLDDAVYYANNKGVFGVDGGGNVNRVVQGDVFGDPDKVSIKALTAASGNDHMLVVSLRKKYVSTAVISGLDVRTAQVAWSRSLKEFKRPGKTRDIVDESEYDGRWVIVRELGNKANGYAASNRVVTLDPDTGKTLVAGAPILQSFRDPDGRLHQPRIDPDDTYDSGSPTMLQPVPGSTDVLFEDSDGISRLDTATGQIVWSSNTKDTRLATGLHDNWALGPYLPGKKYVLAALTAGVAGDLGVLEVATGKLVARWHLDETNASGLLQRPLMSISGTSVLLGRNQARQGSLTDYEDQTQVPQGELNDLGWFTLSS